MRTSRPLGTLISTAALALALLPGAGCREDDPTELCYTPNSGYWWFRSGCLSSMQRVTTFDDYDDCVAERASRGSSGSVDCVKACPSEFSGVQLDSFCRMACCHAKTGAPDKATATCRRRSSLGTSRCQYC